MNTEKKNYYEVLEVAIGAPPQEIERAYMRAKNAYSGDSVALYSLMSAAECEAIVNQIEEAYSILGFPEKRREYDRVRGFNSISKNPFEDATPHVFEAPKTSMPAEPFIDNSLPTQDTSRPNFQYENYGSNLQEAKVSKVQALKKFSLDYNVDQAMEQRIEQSTDFSGAFLREIREYKNVPMERLVEMTRISRTHLEAIENENLAKLPADAYTRGFVSQYAKVLKLNPDLVATSFLHHIKRLRGNK
ncbi:MAG: helix-turn-helix domain-containing protein [Bacteriovoracaceae bacterium]|nr:helix-turn-helix domain-containing protein [Bacteriovoracaceae bacterium]